MKDIVEKLEFGCPFKPGTVGEKDAELAEVLMQEAANEIMGLRDDLDRLRRENEGYKFHISDLRKRAEDAEKENERMRDTVKRLQQKFPTALARARMAGAKGANKSWEEGHTFGKEQKRLREEDNAAFTAEIMKLEERIQAAEALAASRLVDQEAIEKHTRRVTAWECAEIVERLYGSPPYMSGVQIAREIIAKFGVSNG